MLFLLTFALIASFGHAQPDGITWQTTFGGSEVDYAEGVCPRPEGGSSIDAVEDLLEVEDGFVVAGESQSTDFDLEGNAEGQKPWVFKVDGSGEVMWSTFFGSSYTGGKITTIHPTETEGLLLAGTTSFESGQGARFGFVATMSSDGVLLELEDYGTPVDDCLEDLVVLEDGSMVGVGYTQGSFTLGGIGGSDFWLVGVEADLSFGWQQIYGGSGADGGYHILQDADGYLLVGASGTPDGDILANNGLLDVTVLRVGEGAQVSGCTDELACNFDALATEDDGSCEYVELQAIQGEQSPFSYEPNVYSYPGGAGSTFEWLVEGGVITEGQGTNEVIVVWYEDGMESLSVVETTEEGCVGEVVELEIDVVTEVGDLEHHGIRMYPNPTRGPVQIRFSGNVDSAQRLQLRTLEGKLMKEVALAGPMTMDCGWLEPGTYRTWHLLDSLRRLHRPSSHFALEISQAPTRWSEPKCARDAMRRNL